MTDTGFLLRWDKAGTITNLIEDLHDKTDEEWLETVQLPWWGDAWRKAAWAAGFYTTFVRNALTDSDRQAADEVFGSLFVSGVSGPSSPQQPLNDLGIDRQGPVIAISPEHIGQLSEKFKTLRYIPQEANVQDKTGKYIEGRLAFQQYVQDWQKLLDTVRAKQGYGLIIC